MSAAEMLESAFGSFPDLIREYASTQGDKPALILGDEIIDYSSLDALMDRVASALQRDGFRAGDVAAVCVSRLSLEAVTAFLGVLRAGGGVAPIPGWLAAADLAAMVADSGAQFVFVDNSCWQKLVSLPDGVAARPLAVEAIEGVASIAGWLPPVGTKAQPVEISPDDTFNIIYSSGTTGRPKGIVLSNATRWAQLSSLGYTVDSITLISLSIYSNMALLSLLPTLANGGTAVLMPKFDVDQFLELSEKWKITHAMMVPVQVRRVLDSPHFDEHDLSSYRMKLVGGAPFAPAAMEETLRRWPGGLTGTYGLTEGGGSCVLFAHDFPNKLHTVGQPSRGHEVLVIDELGQELAPGEVGEVVGRSRVMMAGYLHQPDLSAEIIWQAPDGRVFYRSGDLGRFDDDGFLELVGRKKDMINSGGFNIYPSDLEARLNAHPSVYDSCVVGVPSDRWGETPVAFVVVEQSEPVTRDELLAWVNERVGKNQRLSDLQVVDALPRNDNGKLVKRELRAAYLQSVN